MVEAQQNIMCQDTGNSPALATCYQPAVAEIRVKTSKDSVGKDMLVCQKHFVHPSYPVIKVISCSVTFEKPKEVDKDITLVNYLPAGWVNTIIIREGKDLSPGEWPMHLASRKVDILNKRITEIYSVKNEGE